MIIVTQREVPTVVNQDLLKSGWSPEKIVPLKVKSNAVPTLSLPKDSKFPLTISTTRAVLINWTMNSLLAKARAYSPLLLGFSTFFAIKDAIASIADHKENPELNAPATPESIMNAISSLDQGINLWTGSMHLAI